jgi:5'-3' exonuclease
MAAKGEAIAPEHAFDSNCITPGTPFMERLGKHLRFFLRQKISSDPTWQKPTVIFSGAWAKKGWGWYGRGVLAHTATTGLR